MRKRTAQLSMTATKDPRHETPDPSGRLVNLPYCLFSLHHLHLFP